MFRPALEPSQPPIQWMDTRVLCLGNAAREWLCLLTSV